MSTANGVSVCVVLFDVGFGGYGGGWEEYHSAGGDLLAIYINKKVWKLYETVLQVESDQDEISDGMENPGRLEEYTSKAPISIGYPSISCLPI